MIVMGTEIPIKIETGVKVLTRIPTGVITGATIGAKAHISKTFKEIGALVHFKDKMAIKEIGQICTNVMSAKLSDL